MLGCRTDFYIFEEGSTNWVRYCMKILLQCVLHFRGSILPQFFFMYDNAPCHYTLAVEELLESEDIERVDRLARCPDQNPIKHVKDFLERFTATNDSGALFFSIRRMGSCASTSH